MIYVLKVHSITMIVDFKEFKKKKNLVAFEIYN